MTDNGFSFSETGKQGSVTKQELNYDYELSDNVVEDLVKYTRSRTVKNEQQFVLTMLGYISGHMENPKHYISGVLIGTAGSGKSHTQNTVAELVSDDIMYDVTTGSEKAIIYDQYNWNRALIANMDELQKPSDDIIEILKSVHGGEDEEFVYKVTGAGEGADRQTDGITLQAVPYWFLYAQYEPDFEMWDRLLKVPVHESGEKNEGVARTHWGHSMVSFGDSDKNYMFDFDEGTAALKDHIRELPQDAWVSFPSEVGEDVHGGSFYENVSGIFDIDRSETNRVASMVANLVRCSALLNHKNRDKRKIKVSNEGVKEAIIAAPQDLANVMACREVLMATTHQLDRKRRAICLAINEVGGSQKAAPIKHPDDKDSDPKSIMGYLRATNASFVKKSQILQMLADLEENGLVEKLERAGEGGRNLYKFTSWSNLGKFKIDDGFKKLFEGTVDPFESRTFLDTARAINDNLTPKASDFMNETEVQSGGGQQGEGQVTLDENTASDEPDINLSETEKYVHEALLETVDGLTIDGLDKHDPTPAELIGVCPLGEPDDEHDFAGTLLDPDHEAWSYGPDEWVETEQEAEREIEKIMRNLTHEGVFKTSTTKNRGGQPLAMKVTVRKLE